MVVVFRDFLIKDYRIDIKMYIILINEFCKEDLFDEALCLLSKVEENDCVLNAITFEIIIHVLIEIS